MASINTPAPLSTMIPTAVGTPAALLTVELLEHILLFLPPKYIARNMQTCQFFYATIKGSIKLQHKFFIVPAPWKGDPPALHITREDFHWSSTPDATFDYPRVELNPSMGLGRRPIRYRRNGEAEVHFRKAYLRPDSAVAQMHLTNPIVPGTHGDVWITSSARNILEPVKKEGEEFTIGDFWRAEQAARETLATQFGVEACDVRKVRWIATLPGAVKFLVGGKTLPLL